MEKWENRPCLTLKLHVSQLSKLFLDIWKWGTMCPNRILLLLLFWFFASTIFQGSVPRLMLPMQKSLCMSLCHPDLTTAISFFLAYLTTVQITTHTKCRRQNTYQNQEIWSHNPSINHSLFATHQVQIWLQITSCDNSLFNSSPPEGFLDL